jgi:1-acyl-sn-glycerol-3-phosphate acyltransferase
VFFASAGQVTHVATPIREIGRSTIESRVFEITRQLLEELGNSHAIPAIRGSAHLDRDLGLGSIERVELLARLDRAFQTSLPESVLAGSETLDDIIRELAQGREGGQAPKQEPRPASAGSTPGSAGPAPAPHHARTWQEVLRYRAEEDGARTHLIIAEGDEEESFSFADIYAGARKVAVQLIERGIRPGDAVALMLPTSSDFFFSFAGVLLAGGVPVPIYPPFRADRIAEYAERQSNILRNCEARLLLTFREAEVAARLLRPQVPSLRGVLNARSLAMAEPSVGLGAPVPLHAGAEDTDLALLQYTSGSTGDPKGVMLTHANLLANVRAIGQALGVRMDDVGVSWLPLYHDMGLIGAWLAPLYFGLPVVVLSPLAFLSRPQRWLMALHRHRGTLTAAPNFAYELAARKIADGEIEGLDLSTVRAALNGAEPVLPETMERFAARFAPYGFRREALSPVYGLAEASLALTFPPPGRGPRVDRVERETFSRDGRAVPVASGVPPSNDDASVSSFVSVGTELPGHEIRIVNAEEADAGDRVEGALWFRGPSVTRGYFRNERATAQLLPEGPDAGWINSGDRAYRADGEIFITGRVKDIILKAGRNLYPHEIEEIAGQVPGVRKGCVVAFGAQHATSGTERLIVVAETRERGATERQRIARTITEAVATAVGLPPDVVELVRPHSIPKTSSGKLRREETRRLYQNGSLGAAAAPPWLQVLRLATANVARSVTTWPRRAFELVYGVYAAIVFVLWIIPTWMLVALAPSRRVAEKITKWGLRLFFLLIGCRIRVVGREHLRTPPPRIFVCNHTSFLDVLALMAALGSEYHFVAKSEVHQMLFIGTFLRKLGHFAFDRSDPRDRVRQSQQIEDALQRGESVFIFPEGTFSAQPGVRAFHLGAFHAAAAARCPVLPVALDGTRRLLRDKTLLPRPAWVDVIVCPPLRIAADAREASWQDIVRLRDAARQAISQAVREPLI